MLTPSPQTSLLSRIQTKEHSRPIKHINCPVKKLVVHSQLVSKEPELLSWLNQIISFSYLLGARIPGESYDKPGT